MIDTAALKRKALILAMSGKLSEQREKDGMAIPKGITVSDSSKDSKAFEIPSNWKWVRVKDVVDKDIGGGTPSKAIPEYWENGDISWVTVKDFSRTENGYIKETIDHITMEGLENSASNLVDEKAVVVCMRMALGKIVRLAKPMAINQDLRALWLKPFVLQDYFLYFYKTLRVEGRGTTVAGIKKDELMNYAFPVPPFEEQKRIVNKIDEIYRLLNKIDELQSLYTFDLEVLKSKLIDAGIQGKLTNQLFEDGIAERLDDVKHVDLITDEDKILYIPNNWSWIRLGWALDIERGGSPRPIKAFVTDTEAGINWIKIGDVEKDGKYIFRTKEKIKPEGVSKSRKVYPGDFLLTNSMSFGRPYISKIEGCIHDGWLLLRNSKELFDLDYLYWLLSSKYVYNQFCKKASGATVDNLNKEKVASAVIPLPPIKEQKRIVHRIEELLQTIQNRGVL